MIQFNANETEIMNETKSKLNKLLNLYQYAVFLILDHYRYVLHLYLFFILKYSFSYLSGSR